jgi:NAD(P)-dependent dehydrogenase (short-subunit alcohol dehydrogenase family)
MEPKRTYIVTGGNTGLGYQCSRFLWASYRGHDPLAADEEALRHLPAETRRRAGDEPGLTLSTLIAFT